MRNRLEELKAAAEDSSNGAGIGDGSGAIAMQNLGDNGDGGFNNDSSQVEENDGEQFMADFFRIVAEVRHLMNEIERKTREVETEHGQALAAISQKQSQKSSETLDKLMGEVQALANQVRKKLKEMDKDIDKTASGEKQADVRIKESQRSILARKFVKLMNDYNEIQTQYKSKYRERVRRQMKIVKPDAAPEEINQIVDSDRDPGAIFANEMMSQDEARQALEDIQDRHKDILKLEKSIRELHELFLDMAILVEQQGEMIDQIEFNVTSAADHVNIAKAELRKAQHYNDSARRKKICLVVIVLLVIVIIVTILIVNTN